MDANRMEMERRDETTTMKTPRIPIVMRLGLAAALLLAGGAPARADLEAYVKGDDGAFAWTADEPKATPQGTIHALSLTSQVWHDVAWTHDLRIYEPKDPSTRDTVLLLIAGGDNGEGPTTADAARGFTFAQACGATCVMLPQVPNQPLLGGKREDALIAETFVRYLETRDESWPLLFPMVKSAVRAMDAVQQWAGRNGRPPVRRFVVAGASKRGWTTWLTAAVDPRVAAIAPMVIDTLNMKAQKAHALEVWGRVSEQVSDYTQRGLTEQFDTVEGRRLWRMVDPYGYRDRLTLPKLLINGTNDPYWTLDALNIYWDDLKGPRWVVYLPNAGHGLQEHRDYAVGGVAALFRHVASDRPFPTISWRHSDTPDGRLRLDVTSSPEPKSTRLWVATAPTRDFRQARWEHGAVGKGGGSFTTVTSRPESGYIALFADLEFEIDSVAYHVSTQIRQAGAEARAEAGK
jgi:PhoPQ-activated pathogenicity-related protein